MAVEAKASKSSLKPRPASPAAASATPLAPTDLVYHAAATGGGGRSDYVRRWLFKILAALSLVLIRQRPGSAKGVVFITLEDEFGVCNLVVWPKALEIYRSIVMGARLSFRW